MKLKNCAECGRVMQAGLRDICPECHKKKEDVFLIVRDYIKDHPKVAIEIVAEATGVSETSIRQFIRDGRLETADLDGFQLTCQRCGKPILHGLYCVLCHQEFSRQNQLHNQDHASKKDKKKSFILDYKKRR
jgi:flagellar operon protein (TIGR03826 family)